MSEPVKKWAKLSEDGKYRYRLTRTWSEDPPVTFICLNPSTADASLDDPTIRKCMGFARRWGHGGIVMVNLFAFRSPKPSVMKKDLDPVGPENDHYILKAVTESSRVIAAWGAHGAHLGRDGTVRHILRMSLLDLHFLKLNNGGSPAHPLYLSYELEPQLWKP